MTSKITICIPTLNRYDLLSKCILSALTGTVTPKKISIIDNGHIMPDGIHQYIKDACDGYDVELTIYTPIQNLGVAKSWNWFLDVEKHPMLICNDDIEFGKYDIAKFEQAYNNSSAQFFFTDNIDALNMFSCFMPTQEVVRVVGLFDETFYPAYFEDNDYARRMYLKAILTQTIPTEINHFGSATIKQYDYEEMTKHHESFRNNKQYYINKWGGEPHNERFTTPFGDIAND